MYRFLIPWLIISNIWHIFLYIEKKGWKNMWNIRPNFFVKLTLESKCSACNVIVKQVNWSDHCSERSHKRAERAKNAVVTATLTLEGKCSLCDVFVQRVNWFDHCVGIAHQQAEHRHSMFFLHLSQDFLTSLFAWNIMTVGILLWILIYSPHPETLEWLVNLLRVK